MIASVSIWLAFVDGDWDVVALEQAGEGEACRTCPCNDNLGLGGHCVLGSEIEAACVVVVKCVLRG